MPGQSYDVHAGPRYKLVPADLAAEIRRLVIALIRLLSGM